MSGPLVHENNDSAGSCYLMEAPDLATVKAFNAADPFTVNGVFETVNIHSYLRRANPYSLCAARQVENGWLQELILPAGAGGNERSLNYNPTNSLIATRNCCGCSSGGQWPQPGNST